MFANCTYEAFNSQPLLDKFVKKKLPLQDISTNNVMIKHWVDDKL